MNIKRDDTLFGISTTKRFVSPGAEDVLFHRFPIRKTGEVELVDYMGGDDLIEYSATLGFGRKIFPEQPSQRQFMDYLVKKGIHTPFKFAQLKFSIQSPITTALTFVYEPSCSVNEYSGRYSEMLDSANIPSFDELNKLLGGDEQKALKTLELILNSRQQSFENYRELISKENDLARELSRGVLGTNNDTRYYWKMDLFSLANFVRNHQANLSDSLTQEYLEQVSYIASLFAPVAWNSLTNPTQEVVNLTLPSDVEIVDSDLSAPWWKPSQTKRVTVPKFDQTLFEIVKFLDHGQFQPIDYMGDDASFAQAARASYGKGTKTLVDDHRLVESLIRDLHTSPIEMAEMAFMTRAPVFIDPRQFGRHRTLDNLGFMNQTPIGDLYYFPQDSEFKYQDRINRQGRGEQMSKQDLNFSKETMKKSFERQLETVTKIRELGVPEEVIRELKGVSFYTKRCRTGDVHNLQHMLGLRWDEHAQYEIQVLAEIIAQSHKLHTPNAYDSFLTHNKNAMRLSSKEIELIRKKGFFKQINPDDLSHYLGSGFIAKNKLGREGISLRDKLRRFRPH
jgi:thymidylate synthase (FAD)